MGGSCDGDTIDMLTTAKHCTAHLPTAVQATIVARPSVCIHCVSEKNEYPTLSVVVWTRITRFR